MADSKKKKSSPFDKVKEGAIGVAKEVTGINDFKKAGDAYKRADEVSKKIDYSGGTKSDIKNVAKATPEYVKEVGLTVGNAAMGALKAASLLTPFGRSKKAVDLAAEGLAPKVTPKIPTPKGGGSTGGYPLNPGPQFKPQGTLGPTGALKTKTAPKTRWAPEYKPGFKPKVSPKTTPAKPQTGIKSSPQFKNETKVETKPSAETAPKLEPKPTNKFKTPLTLGAGLAAGALLKKPEKKEDGTWNPSAIV